MVNVYIISVLNDYAAFEETDLSAAQGTEETDTVCRLDEAQLSILKRVYSALVCDVPILRINGMSFVQ